METTMTMSPNINMTDYPKNNDDENDISNNNNDFGENINDNDNDDNDSKKKNRSMNMPQQMDSSIAYGEEIELEYNDSPDYRVDLSDSSSTSSASEGRCSSAQGSKTEGSDSETEANITGRDDTKITANLRTVVVALFAFMGVSIPLVIYLTTRKNQVDQFQATFESLADKLVDSVEFQLTRKISALDSFRIAITSHALTTNSTWPYVTIPDYDLRGDSVRDLGDMLAVTFHPCVKKDDRLKWENYTQENIEWLYMARRRASTDSRMLQQDEDEQQQSSSSFPSNTKIDLSDGKFSKQIFRLDPSNEYGFGLDDTDGLTLPAWQVVPPTPGIINFNINSHPNNFQAINQTMETGQVTFSPVELFDVPATSSENATKYSLSSYYSYLIQNHLGGGDDNHDGTNDNDEESNAYQYSDSGPGPIATMFYPIFDTFEFETRQVVGIFSAIVYFEQFFTNVLQPTTGGIICVLENPCSGNFSYLIDGEHVTYVGPDDEHDPSFNKYIVSYEFHSVSTSKAFLNNHNNKNVIQLNEEYCPYTLHVYPEDSLHSQYITNDPIIYAFSMAFFIFCICVISLSYDRFLQRRMQRVLKSARESRAIVSSLFPANVRDRLLKEEEERKRAEGSTYGSGIGIGGNSSIGGGGGGGFRTPRRNSMDSKWSGDNPNSRRNSNENPTLTDFFPISTAVAGFAALAPPKMRLKFFLHDEKSKTAAATAVAASSAVNGSGSGTGSGSGGGTNGNTTISPTYPYESMNPVEASLYLGQQSKPIADLFPHCTVLFADISGFTAWSSEREPEQVFTLLQTIFQTFDIIARKREVFKVETIGDCYVAVTGLPDPQPDHAVRMTKFARECMQKVSEITSALEVTLGPGTGDLRMRFGLNSGPVTAGVLRGEKSRFQLFGDTVNTASRMESTGCKNRIQISQSTAQLLIEVGRENWIVPRNDVVHAKGKGAIQTYWVLTRRRNNTGASVDTHSDKSRPKFVKSSLSMDDSTSDIDSIGSGSNNGWVWGDDDDYFDTTSAPTKLLVPPDTLSTPPTHHHHHNQTNHQHTIIQRHQIERLIDWQVDLMVRQLKLILAGREYIYKPIDNPTHVVEQIKKKIIDTTPNATDDVNTEIQNNSTNHDINNNTANNCTIREEIAQSIELPKFDPKAAKLRARHDLIDIPNQVVMELREYVKMVALKYRDNPFHNFAHASHVSMSANKLLSRIVKPEDVNYHRKSVKAIASDLHDYTYGITSDPLTHFAIMFSTLIHDVDHTGVSNGQRSKENPELATKYKNKSVAEQNSVDIAWDLLMEPQFKNLQHCIFATEEELRRFRQLLVNLVMATDIFDKEMKATREMRWEKVFHTDQSDHHHHHHDVAGGFGHGETEGVESHTEHRDLKATIVIEHIIQAADVAHTMQHWHVYKKWNERLFQEMYLAYENGRSEKDPSENWYDGELWFFDNYVIPLAKKLEECQVFGVSSSECLNYALENRKEWALKGKEIVKEMIKNFKSTRKESVNCYKILQGQADEIVFEPTLLEHYVMDEEKTSLPIPPVTVTTTTTTATTTPLSPPISPIMTGKKQQQQWKQTKRMMVNGTGTTTFVSPIVSDMSPSLKTSTGTNGLRTLLREMSLMNAMDDSVISTSIREGDDGDEEEDGEEGEDGNIEELHENMIDDDIGGAKEEEEKKCYDPTSDNIVSM